jgi:hypothetical protein
VSLFSEVDLGPFAGTILSEGSCMGWLVLWESEEGIEENHIVVEEVERVCCDALSVTGKYSRVT